MLHSNSYKMMTADEKKASGPIHPVRPWWRRRRFIILFAVIMFIIIGLAVGLGVAGARAHRCGGWNWNACHSSSTTTSYPSAPTQTPTQAPPAGTGTVTNGVWQPENGTTWQYQLAHSVTENPATSGLAVWDIDLFDNDASSMAALQAQGSKVICYFSGGSYENWRSDKDKFPQADIGSGLDGWDGENWVNINSDAIRQVMTARLDLAVQKGCNGVDPDNVDGYNNDNGLGLTQDDTVNYMKFLADEAHSRGLSIGLKNALEVVPSLVDHMEWAVNEQCLEFDECDKLHPFLAVQKPIFHVEYPKGDNGGGESRIATNTYDDICNAPSTDGFSTIIKNMDLDGYTQTCQVSAQTSDWRMRRRR